MTNVVFHADRTYELDGETYYLTEINGRGFISEEGIYRLEVNVVAIPPECARELSDHLRHATLAFLAERKIIPADSAQIPVPKPLDS